MQKLQALLDEIATKGWSVEQAFGNTWVSVPRSEFKATVQVWKAQGFSYLANIIGIDYLNYPSKKPERFCVTYELVSMPGYGDGDGSRVFARVFVPESDTKVPSLTDLWAGADFLEREVYDMIGIHFEGHPDLRKILTPEDLEGYPLRKDFPLGETPTLFKQGRFIDPAAFRAGLSGSTGGLTGWRGGSRRGYQEIHQEIKKVAEG